MADRPPASSVPSSAGAVRTGVTRALPWVALAITVVFAFVQLHERHLAESAAAAPALSRMVSQPASPPASQPVSQSVSLSALESENAALRERIAALEAHQVEPEKDVERADDIARRVAALPPGPATDELVVHLVSAAADPASAEAHIRTLGAARVLRPRVLEALLEPGFETAHEALLAWATALDAGWTEIERGALARVLRPRAASSDERTAAVARRFLARLGLGEAGPDDR